MKMHVKILSLENNFTFPY